MELDAEDPYVLHVEDDEGDAYLVVRALAQSGCDLRIGRAGDGGEAISLLLDVSRSLYEKPALILLDLKLPLVSGLDVIAFVKGNESLKDIPVVVFTSSDAEKDEADAREHGANDYFVKPIDYYKFQRAVNDICSQYLSAFKHDPHSGIKAFAI